jgi:3',5'-cyclic AMP phosphodiesterase CpdA
MGNLKNKLTVALLAVVLSSCYDFEMRGFITSYENANKRFEQSADWNQQNGFTEINIAQETYTIHAMGDSHVGSTDNLNTFFKQAKDKNATAAVMVGDLTTGHREDYEMFEKHLPEKDSLQYFAVPGNHDLYFNGWEIFYSIFGSAAYYFVVNTPQASDLFICLDTGGGTLGDKQLAWFKKLLETKRSNYRHCTIFTHNNIFRLRPTPSTNPMAEEIQVYIDLFTRHQVNMVVTAHDHKQNTAVLGNTTHIIMDALQDSNEDASYLQLTINATSVDYNFVEL